MELAHEVARDGCAKLSARADQRAASSDLIAPSTFNDFRSGSSSVASPDLTVIRTRSRTVNRRTRNRDGWRRRRRVSATPARTRIGADDLARPETAHPERGPRSSSPRSGSGWSTPTCGRCRCHAPRCTRSCMPRTSRKSRRRERANTVERLRSVQFAATILPHITGTYNTVPNTSDRPVTPTGECRSNQRLGADGVGRPADAPPRTSSGRRSNRENRPQLPARRRGRSRPSTAPRLPSAHVRVSRF